MKKNLDEQKDLVKKLSAQIKDLESFGVDEKGRISKLNDKLKDK